MLRTFWNRVRDRVRPWAAPVPPDDAPRVIVLGAGASGLATAALLRRRGIDTINLDRHDAPGATWAARYRSLRLNTVRWMSDLPGYRMPRPAGRWPGPDAMAGYLADYAAHHRLRIDYNVTVTGVAQHGTQFEVRARDDEPRLADGVVIASGKAHTPRIPVWAATTDFRGEILHSSRYLDPGRFAGQRVVVVGAGSSGGEIAADLCSTAESVTWSVRSTAHVLPREAKGIPTTPAGIVGDLLPVDVVNRAAPRIERWMVGERDFLPAANAPLMGFLDGGIAPLTADHAVELIRAGAIKVAPATVGLAADGAELADGTMEPADAIILATGFTANLDDLVGDLGVLHDGLPREPVPIPGLGFVGFRSTLAGTIWTIELDADAVGGQLARQLLSG